MAKHKLLPRPAKAPKEDEWVCLLATRAALVFTMRKAKRRRFSLLAKAFHTEKGYALMDLLSKSGWRISCASPKYFEAIPADEAIGRRMCGGC